MANLAEALVEVGVVEVAKEPDTGPEDATALKRWVQRSLERDPSGLENILSRHNQPEGGNLLVVVDQFEEVFRYRRISDPNEVDESPPVTQVPSLVPDSKLDINHDSLIRLWQRLAKWVEMEGQAALRLLAQQLPAHQNLGGPLW
jgi:hypothetical protein